MKQSHEKKKRFLTVLLALTGIGITIACAVCLGSCSYLKGDIPVSYTHLTLPTNREV